jgi:hypothetical protein
MVGKHMINDGMRWIGVEYAFPYSVEPAARDTGTGSTGRALHESVLRIITTSEDIP